MLEQSLNRAREFVSTVVLPAPPPVIARSKEVLDYHEARSQAVVVGADVIAFVKVLFHVDIARHRILLFASPRFPRKRTRLSLFMSTRPN